MGPTTPNGRPAKDVEPSETSPLLPQTDGPPSQETTSLLSPFSPRSKWKSWKLLALLALIATFTSILVLGFLIPTAAQRYAEEAPDVTFEGVSVESYTKDGVKVRVLGSVHFDAARVKNFDGRNVGRFAGRLLKTVRTGASEIELFLPGYGEAVVGRVTLPPLAVDIRNGHTTALNFTALVQPVSTKIVSMVLSDALMNRLKVIKAMAISEVHVKAGWFPLGNQKIVKTVVLDGPKDSSPVGNYKLGPLHVGERVIDGHKVLNANVSAWVQNPYSVGVSLPPLGFTAFLPGCGAKDLVATANATTAPTVVPPRAEVQFDVSGTLASLPEAVTRPCAGSDVSPMDSFIKRFLSGEDSVVYVSGDGEAHGPTPDWIAAFLNDITVPVPIPGHTLDHPIKSFGLSNVSIVLPQNLDPGAPEKLPLVSATVRALVEIPKGLDISFGVSRLSAMANVSYEERHFGVLDLHKWMPAHSAKLQNGKFLEVTANVVKAPLNVTDYSVFQKIVEKMLFGRGDPVALSIKASANAGISTPMGEVVVHDLPASGDLTLKGLPGFGAVPLPKAQDIKIAASTKTTLTLYINASAKNPTPWEIYVPEANLYVLHEDTIIGDATIKDTQIKEDRNDIMVSIEWKPKIYGGKNAVAISERVISDFISGKNTTLTLQVHEKSLPFMPKLSKALSGLSYTIPMPHLPSLPPINRPPDEGDDDSDSDDEGPNGPPRFIQSATMHVLSSTADFLIRNPFPHDAINIIALNGTASYNDSTLGVLSYESRGIGFRINPGLDGFTMSPRIPVDWSLDSIGFEEMKKALGGDLKVTAVAHCTLKLGEYQMRVLYNGSQPMKAHVRW